VKVYLDPEGARNRRGEQEAAAKREALLSELMPAVRSLVVKHNLNPEVLVGTGRDGRLTKEDVLTFLEKQSGDVLYRQPKQEPRVQPKSSRPGVSAFRKLAQVIAPVEERLTRPLQTRRRISQPRQRAAEQMLRAQQHTAVMTAFEESDMTAVSAIINRLNDTFEARHGVRLSMMSFFVKAVVDALKAVPEVNVQIDGDEVVTNHYYDIGIAASTSDGPLAPVIRECGRMSFAEIERALNGVGEKVRRREVTPQDLSGGCFTITDNGEYGAMMATPVLTPPQAAGLGVHTIKKRPVVVGDEVVVRPMMYLALSYDQRIIDGRDAVRFMERIVECIENPERMMLEV